MSAYDHSEETVANAYESIAWRQLTLSVLAQVLVPAPDSEEGCSQLLQVVLDDILDQTVNSETMPHELDRAAFRVELKRVNERILAELEQARLDRGKLRTDLAAQHD